MKPPHVALAAVMLSVLVACAETVAQPEIQEPAAEPPVLVYRQATIETPFFTAGSTDAPSLDWKGERGSLTLGNPVIGVTIDPNNGTVSWDPSLPIGGNTINVVAANSAGQTSVNIELLNQFQGEFAGELGPDASSINADLTLDYAPDGTVAVTTSFDGIFASGTWELDGSELTTVFQYSGTVSFATLEAATRTLATDVIHSTTSAELEGPWYFGTQVIEGSEEGTAGFQLTPP